MATLEPTSYRPTVEDDGSGRHLFIQEFDKFDEEIKEAIRRYRETGEVLGTFYSQPFADGKAWYKVTKVRPLTVQHVQVGDGWSLATPHIRGLRLEDIKGNLDFEAPCSDRHCSNLASTPWTDLSEFSIHVRNCAASRKLLPASFRTFR